MRDKEKAFPGTLDQSINQSKSSNQVRPSGEQLMIPSQPLLEQSRSSNSALADTQLEIENDENYNTSGPNDLFPPIFVESLEEKIKRLKDNEEAPDRIYYDEIKRNIDIHLNKSDGTFGEFKCNITFWPSDDMKNYKFFPTFYPTQIEIDIIDHRLVNLKNNKLYLVTLVKRKIPFGFNQSNLNYYHTQFIQVLDVNNNFEELMNIIISSDFGENVPPCSFKVDGNFVYFFERIQEFEIFKAKHYGKTQKDFPKFKKSKLYMKRINLLGLQLQDLNKVFDEGNRRYNFTFLDHLYDQNCIQVLYLETEGGQLKQKVQHCIKKTNQDLSKLETIFDQAIINVKTRRFIKEPKGQKLYDEAHKELKLVTCENIDCDCFNHFCKRVLLIKERYDQILDDRFYDVKEGEDSSKTIQLVQLIDIDKSILEFRDTKVSGSILEKFRDNIYQVEIRTKTEIQIFEFVPEEQSLKQIKSIEYNQEIGISKLQSIELNKCLHHFYYDQNNNISMAHQLESKGKDDILKKIKKILAVYKTKGQFLCLYKLSNQSNEILSSLSRKRSFDDFEKIFKDIAPGRPILIISDENNQIKLFNLKVSGKKTQATCFHFKRKKHSEVLEFDDSEQLSRQNQFIHNIGLATYWKGSTTIYQNNETLTGVCKNNIFTQEQQGEFKKIAFTDSSDKQNYFLIRNLDGKLIRVNYDDDYTFLTRRQYQSHCLIILKQRSTSFIQFIFSDIAQLESLEKNSINTLKQKTFYLSNSQGNLSLTIEEKQASKIVHLQQEDFDVRERNHLPLIIEQRYLAFVKVNQPKVGSLTSVRLRYKANQIAQSSETVRRGKMNFTSFATANYNFKETVSGKFICEYEISECEESSRISINLTSLRFISPYSLLTQKIKGLLLYPNFIDNKIRGNQIIYTSKYFLDINNRNKKYENQFFKFGRQKVFLKGCETDRDFFIVAEVLMKDCFKDDRKFSKLEKQNMLDTQMAVLMGMTPFDMEALLWIDSSVLLQGMFRGQEILMGACRAQMYFNDPREAIEQFQKEVELYELSSHLSPMDSRIIGDQAFFDFNFSSCLEFTLKAGNKFSLGPMLKQIFQMKNHSKSREVIMAILHHILKMPDPPRIIMDLFKSGFEEVEGQRILSIERPIDSEEAPIESISDTNIFVLREEDLNDQIHVDSVVIKKLNQVKAEQDAENPTARIFAVQHSTMSFIQTIIKSKIEDKGNLTEQSLSEMVTKLKSYPDTFMKPTVKIFIDYQFRQSFVFFKVLLLVYSLGFVSTFIASQMTEDSEKKRKLLTAGFVIQVIFFILEVLQMLHYGGLRKYFKLDKWNLLDMVQFFSNLAFYIASINRDFEDERTSAKMTIFVLFIAILSFIKILYFMRLFKGLGALVQMLLMTVQELTSFVTFLFVSVLFFTFAFLMIRVDFEEDEYQDVPRFIIVCIQSYRNSIGDIKTPLYSHWTDLKDQELISIHDYNTILWIIWIFWFINTFLNLIILLNFLIAVISQVYDQTMAEKLLNQYWDKANFNQEYFIIASKFMKLKDLFKVLVVSQAINNEDSTDGEESYVGFVETIKRTVQKQIAELKEFNIKFQKIVLDRFDKKFQGLEQDVQNMGNLKEEIALVNQRLDNLFVEMKDLKDLIRRK